MMYGGTIVLLVVAVLSLGSSSEGRDRRKKRQGRQKAQHRVSSESGEGKGSNSTGLHVSFELVRDARVFHGMPCVPAYGDAPWRCCGGHGEERRDRGCRRRWRIDERKRVGPRYSDGYMMEIMMSSASSIKAPRALNECTHDACAR